MGCAVNGPGEAKGADLALCGGNGEFLVYKKGVPLSKVSPDQALPTLLALAHNFPAS